jgi:hypothetical protein
MKNGCDNSNVLYVELFFIFTMHKAMQNIKFVLYFDCWCTMNLCTLLNVGYSYEFRTQNLLIDFAWYHFNTFRIMAVLKVETDIITNIAWSPKGKACDIRNYVYQEFQNWCYR